MSQQDRPAHRGRTSSRFAWFVAPALLGLMLVWAMVLPIAMAADPITTADFRLPPQDADGWSRLAPAADSRLIYVDSEQGNDASGAIYLPGDPEIGPDPQSPRGTVRAFRTIAAAYAGLREDQPDWLLLRSGRFWNERLDLRRGRSPDARAVATSWGSGARPELRTGADKGIGNVSLVNVAVVGLRFWAHTRDSDGPHFTGHEGSSGISVFVRPQGDRRQVRDVLIEDCVFRSYTNNVLTGARGTGNEPITRFVIRRSIISGNYSTSGHAQGLYHTGAGQQVQPSILLQENLFDHNGWRIQSREGNNAQADGQATMFNHNTYFSFGNGVIFQRNLFLRASSMGNKWTGDTDTPTRAVVTEDNLYVEGEIGVGIGGNSQGPARFRDMVLRHNVMTDIGRSHPTNRSLAWGIELQDWQGGEVDRNLVIHQRAGIGNAWSLSISGTRFEDVVISGNVTANVASSQNAPLVRLAAGAGAVFRDNIVHSPSDSRVMRLERGGFTFAGANRYLTGASQPFQVDGVAQTLVQWRSATGDHSATATAPTFPAPDRDLERYAASLGLGSFEGLLRAMHGQSKANWDTRLTAGTINQWLRAGFGMTPPPATRLRRAGSAPLAPPPVAARAVAPSRPAAAATGAATATTTTTTTTTTTIPTVPLSDNVQAAAGPSGVAPPPPRSCLGLRGLMLRMLRFLVRDGDHVREDSAESGRSRR